MSTTPPKGVAVGTAGLSPLRALILSQTQLAVTHPFMAPLVLNLDFVEDATIPTAATDEHCTTYFNPDYIRNSSRADIEKVLYHEVLHLFFNYFGRRGARDNFRWNVAHDLEIAAEVQPTGCITPEQFNLPPGELGEFYYSRLPKGIKTPCSHGMVAGRGGDQPSPATQRAIAEAADGIIKAHTKGHQAGISKGLLKQAIKIAKPTSGNEQLRKIQGALLTAGASDFSYGRHNRRMGGRGGPVLPALVHHDAHIMCVLDVSGSMGDMTEKAASILLGAVKCVGSGLDVVAWDTHPQALTNVRTARDLAKLHFSGGGTDMAAAIRYCVARGRYDALFVVTDCDTPWPAAKEAKFFPPIYVLRCGKSGSVPKWMHTIQAD